MARHPHQKTGADEKTARQSDPDRVGRRPRVALLTTELGVGGAEQCLVHLAQGLAADHAMEPIVFALAPPPPAGRDRLVHALAESRIPTHFLGLTRKRQILSAIHQVRQFWQFQRPDVVQTFLFHANVVGTAAARRARIENLVLGVRVADPSGTRQVIERWAARWARFVTCVSDDVADYCEQTVRTPRERLRVIPNGIDLAGYQNLPPAALTGWGVPPGHRPWIFVGRMHPQKGVDWLLDVLPAAFAALPDQHLLLVGDGPQRPALQAQAARLGLNDRVHFAGWQVDVPRLLAASSLLLLPSRWEGMPNVVLEAMASGLPVLVARVSGVRQVLGPLGEQQIFTFGQAQEFISKLLHIHQLQHPEQLGAANRERVAERFSLPAMVARYAELYRELTGFETGR
ncbi:MAG: glycosyltransferase [Pirellulaceae bacterium]|nr:glycosyltransferase [Pirellulaceae bacterium]